MTSAPTNTDLLTLAAQIVSAHVAHNAVPMDTLPRVIQSVYATLSGLEDASPPPAEAPPRRGSAAGTGRRRASPDAAPSHAATETPGVPTKTPRRGRRAATTEA
jgi:predicted transcriptional regulator